MKTFYVYMLTNRSRVVLYIGITNSLERRLWFHGNTETDTFVKRYKLDRLVYYENYDNPSDAIAREKQLKRWRREKKEFAGRDAESEVARSRARVIRSCVGEIPRPSSRLGMTALCDTVRLLR